MHGNDNLSNKSKDSLLYDSERIILSPNDSYQKWLTESFSTAPTRVLSVEENYNNNKKHYVKHFPSYIRQTSTPMLPCSISRRKIQSPCITRFYSQSNPKSNYHYFQSFDNTKKNYNSSLSSKPLFPNKFVDPSSAGSTINLNACHDNIEKRKKQKSLVAEGSILDNNYCTHDTFYTENNKIVNKDSAHTESYAQISPSFQNITKFSQNLNNDKINKFTDYLDVDRNKSILINNTKCYDKPDDTIEFFHNLHKNYKISNFNSTNHNFNKSDENLFSQQKAVVRRGFLKRQLAAVDFDEHCLTSQEQLEKNNKLRSVVDITDHKTCAILMSKMKEKQRTVSPL